MASDPTRRKRIGESKLFDLVHSYKHAKDAETRNKRWVQVVDEVENIIDKEVALTKKAPKVAAS